MLRYVLLLLTVLLMTNSGFSQAGYPKVLVPGSTVHDTIWAFTPIQGDSLIKLFVWNDQLRADDSLLHTKLDSCYKAFVLFHHSDSVQHAEILLKTQAIADRDTLITAQKKDIADKKKEIRKLRLHKGLLGVIAIAEGVIIGWLI